MTLFQAFGQFAGSGAVELSNGWTIITPTSVDYSGTSATINANGSVSINANTTTSFNGVFSSTYDEYLVIQRVTTSVADRFARIRWRAGGTDNSTGTYDSQLLSGASTTEAATRYSSLSLGYVMATDDTGAGGIAYMHVYNPYATAATMANSYCGNAGTSSTGALAILTSIFKTGYSADGFTIFWEGGHTGTGNYQIYGLAK